MGLGERDIVDHCRHWLAADGWHVELEVEWVDIISTRNDDTLVAEAKGTTTAAGLDVDTAFGQLLRRTRDDDSTTYGHRFPPVQWSEAIEYWPWVTDSGPHSRA